MMISKSKGGGGELLTNKVDIVMTVIFLVAMLLVGIESKNMVMNSEASSSTYIVVLDVGHGGNDPGKVAGDVLEKDINLQISIKVKEELEKQGIAVVMTRCEDVGLYSEEDTNKKQADMKNRCELINSSNANIMVSIHQNSYSDMSVKGAQVFYYEGSKEGKSIAENIQESIKNTVDSNNTREAKANDSYYIIKNISIPGVIVECGFLTNIEEKMKLMDEKYQEDMAKAIVSGIVAYKNGE